MRLCPLQELPDGDSRGFDLSLEGRDAIFVIRQGRNLFGWRDSCPHIPGVAMAWRRHAYLNAARDHIRCSAHGALFEIPTGICVLGPCLGQSLQPVTLSIDAHDDVHLSEDC